MKVENINAVLSVNPWNHALKLEEWIQVEKVRIHEKYVNKNNEIDNDLALLKLSSDLPVERISQLADLDQVKSENLNLISIGYGQTSPYKNPAPEQNPDSQTEIQKQGTRLNYVNKTLENFDRTAKVFYVDQADNKGLCFGDSGGPGYVFDEAKQDFYILGITSFVSVVESEKELRDPNDIYNNCTGRGHYTNLLLYKDWISQSLTELK